MRDYDTIDCSVILNSKMEASKFNNPWNVVSGEYRSPYMTVNATKVDDSHYAKYEIQPASLNYYLNPMVASSNMFLSEKYTKQEDFSSMGTTNLNTLKITDHLIPLNQMPSLNRLNRDVNLSNSFSNIIVESGASVLTSSWNSFLDNNNGIIKSVKDTGQVSIPISANINVGAFSSCNQLNSLLVGGYITNDDKYAKLSPFSANAKVYVGEYSSFNQMKSLVVGGYETNADKYASQVQFPTNVKLHVGVFPSYNQVNPDLISSSINNAAVYSSKNWGPTYEKVNAGDYSTYNHSNAIIDSFGSLGNIGMRVTNNSLYSSHTIPFIESDTAYTKINLNQYAGLFNKEIDSSNFALYSKHQESRSSIEKAICTVLSNVSSKPEHFGINYIEAAGNTLIINVFFILNGNISGEYVHVGNNITKTLCS